LAGDCRFRFQDNPVLAARDACQLAEAIHAAVREQFRLPLALLHFEAGMAMVFEAGGDAGGSQGLQGLDRHHADSLGAIRRSLRLHDDF
jgi:hypothetical protein